MALVEIINTPLFTDPNLQAYYRAENNLADSGPNGYNLTAEGSHGYPAGVFGQGLDVATSLAAFIASASCPNLEIAGDQTWMSWYKKTSGTDHAFLGKSNASATIEKRMYNDSTGAISFLLTGAGQATSPASSIVDGVFQFFCGVYDQTNSLLKIWVGSNHYDTATSSNATATGGQFALGREGSYSNYANGTLDEVAIFNRALSNTEILTYLAGGYASVNYLKYYRRTRYPGPITG